VQVVSKLQERVGAHKENKGVYQTTKKKMIKPLRKWASVHLWLYENKIPIVPLCDIIIEYSRTILMLQCGWGITSLSLELPNGFLATCTYDEIKIWNLKTGICVRTLAAHGATIETLAVTSEGRLVSSARDKTTIEWNLITGRETKEMRWKRIKVMVHIPDTQEFAFARNNNNAYVGTMWENRPRLTLRHQKKVNALVVLSGWRLASASDDETIRVWDLASGACLRTLKGHRWPVRHLVLLPLHTKLLSMSTDSEVRVWDFDTGDCLRNVCFPSVKSISVSPDSQVVLCATHTVSVWDPHSQSDPEVIECSKCILNHAIALTDGRVATWAKGKIKIWE